MTPQGNLAYRTTKPLKEPMMLFLMKKNIVNY
ncbi:uncharacterized protein METZ01_LOCUS289561 [marine metagenome]|uniref:Uncharacterized protein n=1 Tax=marine metagenome TaxID=408172 RepID=A0A382LN95_9ZZZZ